MASPPAAPDRRLEKNVAGALPMVLELAAVTGLRGATGGAGATRKIGVLHLRGEDTAPSMQRST